MDGQSEVRSADGHDGDILIAGHGPGRQFGGGDGRRPSAAAAAATGKAICRGRPILNTCEACRARAWNTRADGRGREGEAEKEREVGQAL